MIFPAFLRKTILFCGDIGLYYLALIITLIIRFGNNFSSAIIKQHLIPFSCLLPFWLTGLILLDGYDLKVLKERQILAIKIIILCVAGGLLSGIFFYIFTIFGITPKTNLVVFAVYFGFLVFLERALILQVFSKYLQRKIVFWGKTNEVTRLIETINEHPQLGWKNEGLISESDLSFLKEGIRKAGIDTIVVANEMVLQEQGEKFFYQLLPLNISFFDLPTAYEKILKRIPISSVDPKWFLANFKESKKQVFDKFKRGSDIVLSLITLSLTFFLWPIIALGIKIEDDGPIFFAQQRMRKNSKPFLIYKFRTMGTKQESSKTWFVEYDIHHLILQKKAWTAETKDPRITKIGKILRELHLDEIPQMINILKGDISFVGPRPESLETIAFLEKQIPYYHLRHLIKPGFTGWAQVVMSNPEKLENPLDKNSKIQYDFQKVECDLYYIKNRSFFLDLNILLNTFRLFFKS